MRIKLFEKRGLRIAYSRSRTALCNLVFYYLYAGPKRRITLRELLMETDRALKDSAHTPKGVGLEAGFEVAG